MEIERKFRLSAFPEGLPELIHRDQYQGYLCVVPAVRIRHTVNHTDGTESYILCIKSSGTLVRHEVETDITAEQFEELAGMLEHPLVHKDQRVYLLPDGHHLECSVVDEGAFSYAEVEFETEEEALRWQKPDYLGKDMTFDRRVSMSRYWADHSLAALMR